MVNGLKRRALLALDLKDLIAGIVSRPYRVRAATAGVPAAVIDEVPCAALKAEIDALPSNQRLVVSGGLHVYWARARQAPWVVQEIGRLRELTFRAVGEGSGKSADIDLFDAYYLHMFVWDADANAIVGGYRLGLVDEILATYGKRGLYTHSLFKYGMRVLDMLNPSIELGRSFVRAEYQRSFAPMLLLWSGIGRFVERSPKYAVLFGPVSISNSYSSASRRLIVDYFAAHTAETRLMNQVKPRRPFRDHRRRFASDPDATCPGTLDELSRMVAEIEPDHKGVPVLLRQYLRLGGRILAFNVDPEFGNALDGLIMVDLRQVEPTLLVRYMGKSGTMAFRAHHSLDSDQSPRGIPDRETVFGSRTRQSESEP
jgi:putative hemolysin